MSQPIKDLTAALRRLNLSQPQQTIFLSLVQEGPGSARTLSMRTALTRPSVYDQLKSLRQVGLVNELMIDGKTNFAATDLAHVDNLLSDQIDRIERSRESLAAALPNLATTAKTISPKIRFCEGSAEMKNILKDVLWNAPKHIDVTWPSDTMNKVFDEAYLEWFAERLQTHNHNVTLHATPGHPFGAADITYKKITPDKAPHMATIHYGNRTTHISSPTEAFGFIVESSEYADLYQ